MADVGLPPRAHARILDPDEHPAVHSGPGVRAKAMRVALKQAHAFLFDQELGGVAAVLRDLVLVADVEIADSDKIVGEFGGEFVAGGMLDFESLEIEDVRHGGAGQTVELSGVLNQVFPQPEFVIASIQVMRACGSERRKPRRILLPVSISRLKSLPVRGVRS